MPGSYNQSAAWMAPAPAHRAHWVGGHVGGPQMETPLHRNHLVALRAEGDRLELATQVDMVSLQAYDELYPVDGPIEHVYFPLTMMASILVEAGDRTEVDVATVGNEGMLGSMIVLQVLRAWGRTLVQVAGVAVKLPRA